MKIVFYKKNKGLSKTRLKSSYFCRLLFSNTFKTGMNIGIYRARKALQKILQKVLRLAY